MWFIAVEVEQETSAPPPSKKSWIRPCINQTFNLKSIVLIEKPSCIKLLQLKFKYSLSISKHHEMYRKMQQPQFNETLSNCSIHYRFIAWRSMELPFNVVVKNRVLGGGVLPYISQLLYVPPRQVGYLRRVCLKTGVTGATLCPFWSGLGYGFRGTYGSVWTYLSF